MAAHPRAALLFATLLAALLLACGGGKASSTTTAKSSGTATPSAADLLSKAGSATFAVKAFHFSLTQQNATLPMPLNFRLSSADGDYSAPDRLKAAVKAKQGAATISVNAIGIADKTWITNPFTRQWEPLDNTSLADIANPPAIVSALLDGIKDPQLNGEADVNGAHTYDVTGSMDSGTLAKAFDGVDSGHTVAVELWLGSDDSLPRRAKITGQLYNDDATNAVRQVDLSKFGQAVDIQPPA